MNIAKIPSAFGTITMLKRLHGFMQKPFQTRQ